MTSAEKIKSQCEQVCTLLLLKNEAYGDSALQPLVVFGDARRSDVNRSLRMLCVRMDDKLSRIRNAGGLVNALGADGEDTVLDLIGYLVLARIAHGDIDE